MNILSLLIVGFVLLIGELLTDLIRDKWAKQCNYDCSKCKVWDCYSHICLEKMKKGSDKE